MAIEKYLMKVDTECEVNRLNRFFCRRGRKKYNFILKFRPNSNLYNCVDPSNLKIFFFYHIILRVYPLRKWGKNPGFNF